jgi:AcrR family transcriptional regulator
MTTVTGTDGRTLKRRGQETRRRLLGAAEAVFAELGYHEASMVRITEAAGVAQGTFYLYFSSKQEIFEDVVREINRRVRQAVSEATRDVSSRRQAEELGFRAFLRFAGENPTLYRVLRQAEVVAPAVLREHYELLLGPYAKALREAMEGGEIAASDPELLAVVLGGIAEIFGLRFALWPDDRLSEQQLTELIRIIWRTVGGTEAAA